MADTARTIAALQTLLADNTAQAISAQDLRDFLVTVGNRLGQDNADVAAAGSVQGDAEAIPNPGVTLVTGGDDTVGVQLPANTAWDPVYQRITLINTGSGDVKVYPQTGGKIANAATNASVSIQEGEHLTFISMGSEQWTMQDNVS